MSSVSEVPLICYRSSSSLQSRALGSSSSELTRWSNRVHATLLLLPALFSGKNIFLFPLLLSLLSLIFEFPIPPPSPSERYAFHYRSYKLISRMGRSFLLPQYSLPLALGSAFYTITCLDERQTCDIHRCFYLGFSKVVYGHLFRETNFIPSPFLFWYNYRLKWSKDDTSSSSSLNLVPPSA